MSETKVKEETGRALEVIGERRLMKRETRAMAMPGDSAVVKVARVVQGVAQVRRPGVEMVKTGLVASLTTMVLTGFRILRPLQPLHTMAGVVFVGLSVWHLLQNEKRVRRG